MEFHGDRLNKEYNKKIKANGRNFWYKTTLLSVIKNAT